MTHIITHVTVHSHTSSVTDEDLAAVKSLLEKGILTANGRGPVTDNIHVAHVEIKEKSRISVSNPLPEAMYPLSLPDIQKVAESIKSILNNRGLAITEDLTTRPPPAFVVTRHNVKINVVDLTDHFIVKDVV